MCLLLAVEGEQGEDVGELSLEIGDGGVTGRRWNAGLNFRPRMAGGGTSGLTYTTSSF